MRPELKRLTFKVDDMDSDKRLRELVLYIAEKCVDDSSFGAIKLNKILAFADFYSFFRFGIPITGAEYMRLPKGPVPRRMKWVLSKMEEGHKIAITKINVGKFVQHRVVPLRSANRNIFSLRDIEMIDEMIGFCRDQTATSVSDLSHGIAWRVAADRGKIPYESVFLSDDTIDAYDVSRTKELNRRFNWEPSIA